MTDDAIQPDPSSSAQSPLGRAASPLSKALRSYGGLIALGILVVFVIQQDNRFLTGLNLANMGDQWAAVLIMAVGLTYVLAGSGFDISMGSTFALSAVLCVQLPVHHSPSVAAAVAIAAGAVVGLVNGLLVTWGNINPFVSTLATLQIVRGIALLYSNGQDEYLTDKASAPGSIFYILGTRVWGVPTSLIVAALILAVGDFVLAYTAYGRSIHAVGDNYEASYLSGLRVDAIRTSTYVVAGTTAGIAAVVFTARIGSAVATEGDFIVFTVIAAVFIGGITGWGGPTRMWRVVAGVALLAVLQNYFNFKSVNGFWQLIVTGMVILVAVGADSYGKHPHRRSVKARLAALRASGISIRNKHESDGLTDSTKRKD